jgi:Zn-finger nucleic acid-binding protein
MKSNVKRTPRHRRERIDHRELIIENSPVECSVCHREVHGSRTQCLYCGAPLEPAWPEPPPTQEEQSEPAPHSQPVESELTCPRCQVAMVSADMHGLRITRCTQCLGIWLDGPTFDFLIKRQTDLALQAEPPQNVRQGVQRGHGEDRIRYIRCPICGRQMNRSNYAKCSGVIFDQCLQHGVWLDDDELQEILAFIATGGHELAKIIQREAEERVREAKRHVATHAVQWRVGFYPAHLMRWL